MVAMIFDAESPFDQGGDSLSRPQFGPIAMGHGPLRKKDHQLFLLLHRKTGQAARGGLGLQCSTTAVEPCISPSEHTAGVASNTARNLMQREILSQ